MTAASPGGVSSVGRRYWAAAAEPAWHAVPRARDGGAAGGEDLDRGFKQVRTLCNRAYGRCHADDRVLIGGNVQVSVEEAGAGGRRRFRAAGRDCFNEHGHDRCGWKGRVQGFEGNRICKLLSTVYLT